MRLKNHDMSHRLLYKYVVVKIVRISMSLALVVSFEAEREISGRCAEIGILFRCLAKTIFNSAEIFGEAWDFSLPFSFKIAENIVFLKSREISHLISIESLILCTDLNFKKFQCLHIHFWKLCCELDRSRCILLDLNDSSVIWIIYRLSNNHKLQYAPWRNFFIFQFLCQIKECNVFHAVMKNSKLKILVNTFYQWNNKHIDDLLK